MAKVIITNALREEIFNRFKSSSEKIFLLMKVLELNPRKGKGLSHVGKIVIKELKYDKYRFYFITDGHMLKFGTDDELALLLIKFIKMSDKKTQQKKLEEIKKILHDLSFDDI